MASSVFILLAALTKETTGLLLGIAAAWVAIAWASDRVHAVKGDSRSTPPAMGFLAACALGIAAYIGIAVAFSPGILSGAGPRANFTFTWPTLGPNTAIWLD
jgi:hypothetical protein